MEEVLKDVQSGNEDTIQVSLSKFSTNNVANFSIGETYDTRKDLCCVLLSHIRSDNLSVQWAPKTKALALTALKILAREREGIDQLISRDGLFQLLKLAALNEDKSSLFDFDSEIEKIEVIVEAVKCLCNILLNNQHLAAALDQLGCLNAVTQRLSLHRVRRLPYDIVQFDLRLLFLITACGATERVRCREQCNGIVIMINLIDSILFGQDPETDESSDLSGAVNQISRPLGSSFAILQQTTSPGKKLTESTNPDKVKDLPEETVGQETSPSNNSELFVRSKIISSRMLQALGPVRETTYCLHSPLDDKTCILLNDALKILFNQTLDWADKDCEEDDLVVCTHLAHLLKILLLTIQPICASKSSMQTIVHTIEVLVNIPEKCAHCFLIPSSTHITQMLHCLHPTVFIDENKSKSPHLFKSNLDQIFDDWNMATIVSLLNFLDLKLTGETERHCVSPVLTALRLLSKGHRSIRRFLKAEILPPLREIKDRPEVGDTLKSRLVRLMVAGTHGAEEVTAEFLFVLCKENANCLVKHTGYGNAAGLLLAHGLLAGGVSVKKEEYSSDSETSDTEEYNESKKHIDPVTGGPVKEPSTSLDEMTDEEKEREAEKLEGLLRKLDEHGIIKMVPLDEHNKPLGQSEESTDESN